MGGITVATAVTVATGGAAAGTLLAAVHCAANGALMGAITQGAVGAVTGAVSSPYCFVAGTTVLTAAGAVVVETYVNETDELVHIHANGEEIVCTPAHPFCSPIKGWTDAVHLRAGDILVLGNGEYVVVEKVQHEILESPIKVCNFQVEDYHTYYVSEAGVLVHDTCSYRLVCNKSMRGLYHACTRILTFSKKADESHIGVAKRIQ